MAQQVEQPDDEIQADVEARAVPADLEVAEERQEDQVVEAPIEHDSVIVDGVEFCMSSSLAAIPAGCESLGLSKRGGKQKCLKRMIELVQSQELMAAIATTVKVWQEHVRSSSRTDKTCGVHTGFDR